MPDIVDCIVDITETGRALRAAGLKIIGKILQSYTELIANRAAYDDPDKRHAMEQLKTLLDGVLEARGKVLVKLNVRRRRPRRRHRPLPSMKSPTVSKLFGEGGYAVETVVPEVGDQHADPRPQGRRRQRHHRAPARQDRPLRCDGQTVHARSTTRVASATVTADDGTAYPFHCTAIADGTRTIAVGTAVRFEVVAGRLGRWEAADLVRR